jgi:hypothetical protein
MEAFTPKGSYDDPLVPAVPASGPPKGLLHTGLGVLPDPPVSLGEHVDKHLKKARPLGLVRLALVNRDTDDVYFVSRLLRMYGNDPTLNFPITKYLWSLRCLPGYGTVQVWWVIYIPMRGRLVDNMLAGRRTLKQIASNPLDGKRVSITGTQILAIASSGDGSARCIQRYFTNSQSKLEAEPANGMHQGIAAILKTLRWDQAYTRAGLAALTLPRLFEDYDDRSDPTKAAS